MEKKVNKIKYVFECTQCECQHFVFTDQNIDTIRSKKCFHCGNTKFTEKRNVDTIS